MNTLILICLLWIVVCSVRGTQGSEATYSSEPAGVTRGPASGEGLQDLLPNDDELEADEELSGGDHVIIHDFHHNKDARRRRRGKGKRRNKQKNTTPFNPEHTIFTNGYTSILTTTEDPCNSTHLGYCIHGYCKYLEGLQEPVCICMKGYDGERCGIQTLETIKPNESYNSELMQTVLVVIAVILSSISCCAILLMTCAHYRSHKNFLASYLGTGSEQEKLQKSIGDVVV
ncbi:proheparin-binding EGF-like growth factor [Melanotaenia boesemani]|uniref:proheparin-binding EGF-like growth factor n=1 Tax=Melanotaenia boesemani TaxID=1250792 RepID=UPI001C05B274|nr:proheparin-binding EGF-like growth factor [Melanotaenia boesemani]